MYTQYMHLGPLISKEDGDSFIALLKDTIGDSGSVSEIDGAFNKVDYSDEQAFIYIIGGMIVAITTSYDWIFLQVIIGVLKWAHTILTKKKPQYLNHRTIQIIYYYAPTH